MTPAAVRDELLYGEMYGPPKKFCPRCRSPLQEYIEGCYRCAPCRLVPDSCVCPPIRPSLLDFEDEALVGVVP